MSEGAAIKAVINRELRIAVRRWTDLSAPLMFFLMIFVNNMKYHLLMWSL